MGNIEVTKATDERACNNCLRVNFDDGVHELTDEIFELDIGKGGYKVKLVLCADCLLELRQAAADALLPGSCG